MKVLIIGIGSIAQKHIDAIRRIDSESCIYALRSNRDSRNFDNVISIYDKSDIPEGIDFIIISNPTSIHAETINKFVDLKKPLFIEKPLFESTKYDDIIDKVHKSGVMTYVACNLRFLESLNFVKDYIDNNPHRLINEVNVYCGSYLPEWRPKVDFRKCYSAIPELGGGVHKDLIHEIDYVYWLFGKPDNVSSTFRNVSSLNIRAIDYANYILLYPRFTVSITLNYFRRDYKRMFEIVFEDETWTIDIAANLIKSHKGNVIFKGNNDILSTYELQMQYFIDIISSNIIPDNNIDTAYDILKICLNNE